MEPDMTSFVFFLIEGVATQQLEDNQSDGGPPDEGNTGGDKPFIDPVTGFLRQDIDNEDLLLFGRS